MGSLDPLKILVPLLPVLECLESGRRPCVAVILWPASIYEHVVAVNAPATISAFRDLNPLLSIPLQLLNYPCIFQALLPS